MIAYADTDVTKGDLLGLLVQSSRRLAHVKSQGNPRNTRPKLLAMQKILANFGM